MASNMASIDTTVELALLLLDSDEFPDSTKPLLISHEQRDGRDRCILLLSGESGIPGSLHDLH